METQAFSTVKQELIRLFEEKKATVLMEALQKADKKRDTTALHLRENYFVSYTNTIISETANNLITDFSDQVPYIVDKDLSDVKLPDHISKLLYSSIKSKLRLFTSEFSTIISEEFFTSISERIKGGEA